MAKKSLVTLLKKAQWQLEEAEGIFDALNDTLIEILSDSEYVEEFDLSLRTSRTRDWDSHLALLVIKYRKNKKSTFVFPVPELKSLAPELAKKIWRKIMSKEIFAKAAFSHDISEEMWNAVVPVGTELNANLDFHGLGKKLTDREMTVREALAEARSISIPWNTIGSQWFRVHTPYGVVFIEHYARNMSRGERIGFSPTEELLKYAAELEIRQFNAGEIEISKMDQKIISGEIFDANGSLVSWLEEVNDYEKKLRYNHVRGGYGVHQYLIWRDVDSAIPAGGYAILVTKYAGTLKLTATTLEAYEAPAEAVVEYDYREDGVYVDGELAGDQRQLMWNYIVAHTEVGEMFDNTESVMLSGFFYRGQNGFAMKKDDRPHSATFRSFARWEQPDSKYFVPAWYKSLVVNN